VQGSHIDFVIAEGTLKEPEVLDFTKMFNVGDIVTFNGDPQEYKVMTVSPECMDFMPLIPWRVSPEQTKFSTQ
jgi:hypothetical protein